MRAVNLLPRDDRRDRRKTPPVPVLVGVVLAVLVAVALSAAFLTASGKVADKKSQLLDLRAQRAALPPAPVANTAEEALNAEKQQRITAVSTALSRRVDWDRVLREAALVLPDDVWLTSLTAKAPISGTGQATSTGSVATGFVINGYTYSQDAVARLLTRLAVIPDLTNLQLGKSVRSNLSGQNVVQFSILADIKPPGASS